MEQPKVRELYVGFFSPDETVIRRDANDGTIYAQLGERNGKLYAQIESNVPFRFPMRGSFEYIKEDKRADSDEARIDAVSFIEIIVKENNARGRTKFHQDAEKLERLFRESREFLSS